MYFGRPLAHFCGEASIILISVRSASVEDAPKDNQPAKKRNIKQLVVKRVFSSECDNERNLLDEVPLEYRRHGKGSGVILARSLDVQAERMEEVLGGFLEVHYLWADRAAGVPAAPVDLIPVSDSPEA
ncbi:uncharacterized protein LOC110036465 [Phalaenopsis equestris]|uniref:uncharacterized protein LOC110036465 n=1 Tax=Phalaenopsis equestris TaxID=78828 RepID=UPI0009E2A86C|nr:uncharacterized protein LOC110036465 [Phalaenopsis equestris]